MSVEVSERFAARTMAGARVHRVATNAGGFDRVDLGRVSDLADVQPLMVDTMLYGDAWVDEAGRRVDPRDVVVEQTAFGLLIDRYEYALARIEARHREAMAAIHLYAVQARWLLWYEAVIPWMLDVAARWLDCEE